MPLTDGRFLQTRRMAVMRAVEDYNEKFVRKIDAVCDIAEAEFAIYLRKSHNLGSQNQIQSKE